MGAQHYVKHSGLRSHQKPWAPLCSSPTFPPAAHSCPPQKVEQIEGTEPALGIGVCRGPSPAGSRGLAQSRSADRGVAPWHIRLPGAPSCISPPASLLHGPSSWCPPPSFQNYSSSQTFHWALPAVTHFALHPAATSDPFFPFLEHTRHLHLLDLAFAVWSGMLAIPRYCFPRRYHLLQGCSWPPCLLMTCPISLSPQKESPHRTCVVALLLPPLLVFLSSLPTGM